MPTLNVKVADGVYTITSTQQSTKTIFVGTKDMVLTTIAQVKENIARAQDEIVANQSLLDSYTQILSSL